MSCGPSGAEKELAGQEQSFSQMLQENYQTQFANQSQVLSTLNHTLTPIVDAGPNQQGYSAPELAAMNTQAINSTGANYKNAAQALNGQLAGRTSANGLESGVDQQLKAALASTAAGTLSNEQADIIKGNYATGRANFQNATGGLQALSGDYNPESYAGLTSQSNNQAFGQADKINTENQQFTKDLVGGITSLAGPLISGGMSALSGSLFGGSGQGGGGGGPQTIPTTSQADSLTWSPFLAGGM